MNARTLIVLGAVAVVAFLFLRRRGAGTYAAPGAGVAPPIHPPALGAQAVSSAAVTHSAPAASLAQRAANLLSNKTITTAVCKYEGGGGACAKVAGVANAVTLAQVKTTAVVAKFAVGSAVTVGKGTVNVTRGSVSGSITAASDLAHGNVKGAAKAAVGVAVAPAKAAVGAAKSVGHAASGAAHAIASFF